MSLARSSLAAAVFLAACGGATTAGTTTPESTRPRRAVVRADVVAPSNPLFTMPHGDGAYLVFAGGRRVRITADGATAADVDFGSPIVGAAETPEGWLYMTADGVLYRTTSAQPGEAAGPLDRPQRRGRTALSRLGILGGSRGRLVVLAGEIIGDLYTTAGGAPERAPLPPRSVVGATFTDVDHGCALLFDGTARVTSNGGREWQVVPGFDDGFALELVDGRCRYHSGSPRDPVYVTVGDDGRMTELDAEPPEVPAVPWAWRPPELLLGRLAIARVGGRTALAFGADPSSIDAFDLATGAFRETLSNVLPAGCSLHDVGEAAVAVCRQEGRRRGVYVTRDGRTFERLSGFDRALVDPNAAFVGSDDGQLAWNGPCARDPRINTAADTICVAKSLDPEAEQVSISTDALGTSMIRAIAGEHLLLQSAEGAPWVADLASGEMTEVAIEGARGLAAVDLAPDGTLVMTAIHANGTRALHLGPVAGPWERRALPERTLLAGFSDALHGIAAGRSMRDLYRTEDGGETWSPVRVRVEGNAQRMPLLDPEQYVECHRDHCLAYSWRSSQGVAVVVHTTREEPAYTVLAAEGASRLPGESVEPLGIPRRLVCRAGDVRPLPERPRPAPRRVSGTAFFTREGGHAWVDAVAERGGVWKVMITWSGVERERAFAAQSALFRAPTGPAGASVDVVVVDSRAAVINACAMGEETVCRLALVRDGQPATVFERVDPIANDQTVLLASRLDERTTILSFVEGERPRVVFVDLVDATAREIDLSDVRGASFAGLAMSSLGPLLAFADSTGRAWSARTLDARGRLLPFAQVSAPALEVCADDVGTANVVQWPYPHLLGIGDRTMELVSVLEIAMPAAGPCIRAVRVLGPTSSSAGDASGGGLVVGADGKLHGRVLDREGEHALTCTIPTR